jgi:hypothetical protein
MMSGDNRTSSNPGGAPGGMGGSTGADPRTPAAGAERSPTDERRSFAPGETGRTSPAGDGGGVMSGRGQERGPDSPQGPGTGAPGQGGDHLMGRSGGQDMGRAEVGDMRHDLGEDSGALSGAGSEGGAAAAAGPSGDAPRVDYDPGMTASSGGMVGDAADGANTTSGAGGGSVGATGAAASGDAHLGKDGRKLGEPANANRQVPSSGATGGIGGGSGAD